MGTIYQTNILFSKFHRSTPEKNANYCYSYLSKKICRNEAITTLQLVDIAFPKQLDELYSVHIPTASGEGVSVDVANSHLIKCMLEDSEKDFWSEKSVFQQKFGLKNMMAYLTGSLTRTNLAPSMRTSSPEAIGICT